MIFMYLSKKPQPPKYTLAPFLFLNVVSLMNGELFSTSSTDRLYVTLYINIENVIDSYKSIYIYLYIL